MEPERKQLGFTTKLSHASVIRSRSGSMAGRRLNGGRDFKGAAVRKQARSLRRSDGACRGRGERHEKEQEEEEEGYFD